MTRDQQSQAKQARVEKMLAMRREGKTLAEIAQAFGVTRARVGQLMGKTGSVDGTNRGQTTGPRKRRDVQERFWEKVDRRGPDECWLYRKKSGWQSYGKFAIEPLHLEGSHRVAWKLANGQEIPDGMDVLHSCDTPLCCNPRHLRLGTAKENTEDMDRHGRRQSYVLSNSDKAAIVNRVGHGERYDDLAKEYGVSPITIYRTARNYNKPRKAKPARVGEGA